MFRSPAHLKLRWRWRADRRLVVEAACWLAVARLAVMTIPFRWTTKLLAFRPAGDNAPNQLFRDTASLEFARRASKVLRVVAACTPWQSNCFTQAIAGAGMLRLRHIAATLAMGVKKQRGQPGALEAHAWLCCCGFVLTGATGRKGYQVVATFSSSSKRGKGG